MARAGRWSAPWSPRRANSGYLGTAIAALKGPFGIAVTGAVALGGALYYVELAARAAEAALSGAYNAALVSGRNMAVAEANTKAMGDQLGRLGVGEGTALPFAAALEGVPNLAEKAKQSLLEVSQAWTAIQFGGDYGEAAKGIERMFGSVSSMKKLVDENRLLTGQAYQDFAKAAAAGNTEEAGNLLAGGLAERYKAAQAALTAQGNTGIAMVQPGMPAEAAEGAYIQSQEHPRLPGPLTMPSAGEMRANIDIAEGNKLQNERAGYLARIKEITDQIAGGTIKANDATRNAIDYYNERAAQIDKQLHAQDKDFSGGAKGPTEGEQLRARMAEAENAAAAHAKNLKDLHQGELQADIGVLSQELSNEKLTASQRLAVEADLARKKAELMAADLRGGGGRGGGRAAKEPSAAAQRGGGAEARSQYEDFAAGEREKVAAAEGSGTQIQAIYQEWAARAKAQFGETSREYANVMRQMTEAAQREARAQARALAEASRQAYEEFAAAERDKIAVAQGSTAQVLAIYQDWANRAKALFGEQSTQYQNVMRQMTEAADRASDKMAETFAKPLDTLGSSLESAATGLLTRQTTAARAEQEAVRGLIGSGVHEVGAGIETSLTSALFGSGTKSLGEGLMKSIGVGGPGGLFGTGIGAVASDTSGATFATSVGTFSTAVGVFAGSASTGGAASLAGGVGSAAGAAGGIGSFLGSLPLIGSLFGGVSGSADQDFSGGVGAAGGGLFSGIGSLFGFAHGGIMPPVPRAPSYRIHSYAAGGVAIPGLAKLHENEMVLPPDISQGMQQFIRGGGGAGNPASGGETHVHLHNEGANILDGPSFHRWFQSNGGKQMIHDMIKNAFRSNALTPRTM